MLFKLTSEKCRLLERMPFYLLKIMLCCLPALFSLPSHHPEAVGLLFGQILILARQNKKPTTYSILCGCILHKNSHKLSREDSPRRRVSMPHQGAR